MSNTPEDSAGHRAAPPPVTPDRGVPDRGVPAHDATLFDDPNAPLTPPVVPPPVTPSSTLAPAADPAPPAASPPAAPAAPLPPPPAAAAPAAPAPNPWVPRAPGAMAPPRPAQPITGLGDDESAAAPLPAPVDTGRLFRSAGAEGDTAAHAIPALPAEPPGGPAATATGVSPATWIPAATAAAAAGSGPASPGGTAGPWTPVPPAGAPVPAAWPSAGQTAAPVGSEPFAPEADTTAETAGEARPRGGAGLTWTGVTVVLIGVTVLMAFADVLVTHGIGVITGVGLVLATLYCALTVRPADLWAAVVTPPLAYLVALLTAGQFTLPSGGSLLVREGFMVFTGLALNAPWIIGATLLGLVIVLVRRSRARRAGTLPVRAATS